MTTTVEPTIKAWKPPTWLALCEENKIAIVEALGTYSRLSGVSDPVVIAWRIVARRKDGTGREFGATLSACIGDRCRLGGLVACEKPDQHITVVNAWLKHIETHCHGWHEPSITRFMREVLATYGAPFTTPRTVGVPASKYRADFYAAVTE